MGISASVPKLRRNFYTRKSVLTVSKELIGQILVTHINGELTTGRIVETEAYAGITDRASHAFGGRRTPRTDVMYAQGGTSYVYLCYGIHHLFNRVTHQVGTPQAPVHSLSQWESPPSTQESICSQTTSISAPTQTVKRLKQSSRALEQGSLTPKKTRFYHGVFASRTHHGRALRDKASIHTCNFPHILLSPTSAG